MTAVSNQLETHDVPVADAALAFIELPGQERAPGDREIQRTQHAVRLFDFGQQFSSHFLNRTYGDHRAALGRPWRLRLTDPDEPSTAGGRLARRSLLLCNDADPRDTMMIGWVDVSQKRSEVRTYESVGQHYMERFRRPIDLSVDEYAELHFDLMTFLRERHVQLALLPAALRLSFTTPVRERPRGYRLALYWGLGILTGFCLGFAWFSG